MAKTASNKNKEQAKQEKMAMVFMSIRSSKTGAYTFKKSILPKEEALKLLAQNRQ